MNTEAVKVQSLSKTFSKGTVALQNVSLSIRSGEMVALIGASGSGKSTLLRHMAGLVKSDCDPAASVTVFGEKIQHAGKILPGARKIRASVGVIFQQFNLIGRLSLLTNVLTGYLGVMPRLAGTLGLFSTEQRQAAMQALSRVGVASQALQRGSDLSGGQQQRAAIARTLVQGAKIIIADEPIASLDPSSARKVMDILDTLNREDNTTIIVSLHQVEYALKYCPRTVALRKGQVVYDGPSNALTPEFLGELYGAQSEELFLPGLEDASTTNTHTPDVSPVQPVAAVA